ncbi:MAG: hypothetical protein IRY95_03485, partial [Clostridia bacterium]|nr:hypothetical protein [Clostridia bacterium]
MVELLRSWMFTPANRDPMLAKAGSLGADVTVIDLEDAVPPREKQEAAVNVRRYYRPIRERNPRGRLYVRINAVEKPAMSHGGDYYEARGIEDIRHVVGEGLDGIILPKSESASMLHRAAAALEVMERERGLPVGTTRILVLIETVRGLTDIARIAEAAAKEPRVIGFCFGAGDFTLDADMEWSRGEAELVPARFAVALWARRAGFQHVIDSPWA